MNTIFVLVFLMVSAISGVANAAPEIFNYRSNQQQAEVLKYRVRVLQESELRERRRSSTYQKIFRICAARGAFHKQLQYMWHAQFEYMWGGINQSTPPAIMQSIQDWRFLSQALNGDLQDETLYLALSDCGYTAEQSGLFIMGLISADISGKIVAGLGYTLALPRLFGFMRQLQVAAPLVYNTISAAGMGAALYELVQLSRNGQLPTGSTPGAKQIHNVTELKAVLNNNSPVLQIAEDNTATLDILALKIQMREAARSRPTISPAEYEFLSQEIASLRIKYANQTRLK